MKERTNVPYGTWILYGEARENATISGQKIEKMREWVTAMGMSAPSEAHAETSAASTVTESYNVTRWGATFGQLRNDLTNGIDGQDVMTNILRIPRNVGWAAWHTLQSLWPLAADTADALLRWRFKKYNVQSREGQPYAGTGNSLSKIGQSAAEVRPGAFLSGVFAEGLDGPVDDIGSAVMGAPNVVVRPVRDTRAKAENVIATHSGGVI